MILLLRGISPVYRLLSKSVIKYPIPRIFNLNLQKWESNKFTINVNLSNPYSSSTSKYTEEINKRISDLVVNRQITLIDDQEYEGFMNAFHIILKDILDHDTFLPIPEFADHHAKTLIVNTLDGKNVRSQFSILCMNNFISPEKRTPEMIKLSRIATWCVEFVESFFVVSDDVIDQAKTRRGRPCWYKLPNIGLSAFNDSTLIESDIFILLKKHFQHKPYYINLVHLFTDCIYKTKVGQCIDALNPLNYDFMTYTTDQYNAFVRYKASYYSFQLPVFTALYMAEINDLDVQKHMYDLTMQMGHFYQLQDDFLDCFVSSEQSGKIGTDISEGKCTFFITQALERANESQRKIIKECYRSEDKEKINKIIQLYNDLKLYECYKELEKNSLDSMKADVKKIPKQYRKPFDDLFEILHHRSV